MVTGTFHYSPYTYSPYTTNRPGWPSVLYVGINTRPFAIVGGENLAKLPGPFAGLSWLLQFLAIPPAHRSSAEVDGL